MVRALFGAFVPLRFCLPSIALAKEGSSVLLAGAVNVALRQVQDRRRQTTEVRSETEGDLPERKPFDVAQGRLRRVQGRALVSLERAIASRRAAYEMRSDVPKRGVTWQS